jgi:RNA polymerase sigma factor (sigma-70 family)
MAIGRRVAVDKRLRALWTVGVAGDADDRTLLSRYALSQDEGAEEAFRVLVERHRPMVLRVCRRVMGDLQEAEDATQAVFLVLARKAGSIWEAGTVAPWLHGVARRIAAKARVRAAARRCVETQAASVAASLRDSDRNTATVVEDWDVIHEEVDRLPAKYRALVVLCYLEGQTYEQAARQIGCPVGTVRVRLSRARERLRTRLTRRGIGPERVAAIGSFADAAGGVWSSASVAESVAVGAGWVEATIQAARTLSISRHPRAGTVPASVLEFYEDGMRAMIMKRCVTAAAWLLAAGLTGVGAIGLAGVGAGEQEKAALPGNERRAPDAPGGRRSSELPIDFDSPEALGKHTESRVKAARQHLDFQRAYYKEGRIAIDRYIHASEQLMLAELAASANEEQRVAAAKANMDRITELVKLEQEELVTGNRTPADVAEAVVAYENAACAYLEVRHGRGPSEIEILRKRVEALEKQLGSPRKPSEPPVTRRN